MKRKLIALAVASVFVAPVAMADSGNVTMYGVMHGSFDNSSTGNVLGGSSINQTKVSSNQSRIGFKGTEDLGGGTNAVWQIENGINADNNAGVAGTWNNRNTFVGLNGASWGQVTLGNQDTPYKSSTRGMDMFADTVADNRSLMGGTAGKNAVVAFDGRASGSILYSTPDLGGIKLSMMYIAGAETAIANGDTKGNAYSLAGTYASGPITGVLAYETHDMGSAGTGTLVGAGTQIGQKERALKLGGGYAVDQLALNIVYEKTTDGFGVGGVGTMDHKAWYLGGKYNISASDAVKVAYTSLGSVGNNAPSTGAKQFTIGYDHGMSKRTTVYALYTRLSNETCANYAIGIGGNTSGASVPTAVPALVPACAGGNAAGMDADPSAFSIGLKHSF